MLLSLARVCALSCVDIGPCLGYHLAMRMIFLLLAGCEVPDKCDAGTITLTTWASGTVYTQLDEQSTETVTSTLVRQEESYFDLVTEIETDSDGCSEAFRITVSWHTDDGQAIVAVSALDGGHAGSIRTSRTGDDLSGQTSVVDVPLNHARSEACGGAESIRVSVEWTFEPEPFSEEEVSTLCA